MDIMNAILGKIFPSAQTNTDRLSPLQPEPTETGAVDVADILRGMDANKTGKLDWQHSIVDLMKLLDMPSDLRSRQSLAKELGYSGDLNDSAKMNVWLHQQVMHKLEANGGKIPPEMKQ